MIFGICTVIHEKNHTFISLHGVQQICKTINKQTRLCTNNIKRMALHTNTLPLKCIKIDLSVTKKWPPTSEFSSRGINEQYLKTTLQYFYNILQRVGEIDFNKKLLNLYYRTILFTISYVMQLHNFPK